MIHRLTAIPEGLLECPPDKLLSILPGTCLITLAGISKVPLFLSVLLHGNEPTGLLVAQNILRKYRDTALPRTLMLFIGNVHAASEGKRKLDTQPDYNRIWLEGSSDDESDLHQDIAVLLHEMARKELFASIDIHNNTGINPHYACINKLSLAFLNLARRFSRTIIYFIRPSGVQSKAFSYLCPSVTLECGKVGDEIGVQLATAFVDEVLNWDNIPEELVSDSDIDLFHTRAIVKIPEQVSFSFDNTMADIRFIQGIESLNFEEVPAGTTLARIRPGLEHPFVVLDEDGKNISASLFRLEQGELVTCSPLMPSMPLPAVAAS